jgi:hypothetical protein
MKPDEPVTTNATHDLPADRDPEPR